MFEKSGMIALSMPLGLLNANRLYAVYCVKVLSPPFSLPLPTMKQLIPALLLVCLFSLYAAAAEKSSWNLNSEILWTREPNTLTLNRENGDYLVTHTGSKDWGIRVHPDIPVSPGDAFRISCTVQNEESGDVSFTVAMFDHDKKVITFFLGSAVQRGPCEPKTLTDEFVIPWGGVTISPRINGIGVCKARFSDLKLIKLDNVALLEPQREIPAAGAEPLELLPPPQGDFTKNLKFRGWAAPRRELEPQFWLDTANTYQDKPTWRIVSHDVTAFDLTPTEPFKVTPGERVFVSLRIFVERGKPFLAVLPWHGTHEKAPRATALARGTFQPQHGEETGMWCCIHAYVTVPEGIQGLMPVVSSDSDGAVFNLAEWTISRPSEEELHPTPKKVEGWAKERVEEKLDRGLVAVRKDKDVYLSWRLLKTDKPDAAFDVYRSTPDGKEEKRNTAPITQTTDFVDKDVAADRDYRWSIRTADQSSDPVAAWDKPYISIPLKDTGSFFSIGVGDLDGDGKLDYVIKTPNYCTETGYINWKRSPGTYKLQAYQSDGTFLWEYDLGWGIEQGIWFSPYIVADLDGDGCAEIAVKTGPGDPRNYIGRVFSGPEHVTVLDGKTGKERCRIDWPSREGMPYSTASRNQLCVAYLDGKTPCLIVQRGTYYQMVAVAYQMRTGPDRLEKLWRWDNHWDQSRWGQGAHTTHAVDLDGDGRDEVILGSIALDDDGSILWEMKLGHPDHVYVGDIDPSRPGLEVVFGIESRQNANGVCMIDSKTGAILWGHDKPTHHIHHNGMVSPIDAAHPGCQIWSGEAVVAADRWLRDAKGNVLEAPEKLRRLGLAPKAVWWDANLQRKLIGPVIVGNAVVGSAPVHYPSFEEVDTTRFEGGIRLIGDLFGDWREEVVTAQDGEIRIYSTTIPAKDRRTTFLQDRNYRATLTESTTGYPQIPLPSNDLSR